MLTQFYMDPNCSLTLCFSKLLIITILELFIQNKNLKHQISKKRVFSHNIML